MGVGRYFRLTPFFVLNKWANGESSAFFEFISFHFFSVFTAQRTRTRHISANLFFALRAVKHKGLLRNFLLLR